MKSWIPKDNDCCEECYHKLGKWEMLMIMREYAQAWKGWSRNYSEKIVLFHVRVSCLASWLGQEFHKAYVCGVI